MRSELCKCSWQAASEPPLLQATKPGRRWNKTVCWYPAGPGTACRTKEAQLPCQLLEQLNCSTSCLQPQGSFFNSVALKKASELVQPTLCLQNPISISEYTATLKTSQFIEVGCVTGLKKVILRKTGRIALLISVWHCSCPVPTKILLCTRVLSQFHANIYYWDMLHCFIILNQWYISISEN